MRLVAEDPLEVAQQCAVHVAERRQTSGHRVSERAKRSWDTSGALSVIVGTEPVFGDEDRATALLVHIELAIEAG